MKPALALSTAILLSLTGCGSDDATRSQEPARPAAAVPAAPEPPVSRFNGRYVGTILLNPDRSRTCFPASTTERVMQVANGQVTVTINPELRQVLLGTVRPDGSLRARENLDRTIVLDGLLDGTQFLGTFTNGRCTFAVSLRRQ